MHCTRIHLCGTKTTGWYKYNGCGKIETNVARTPQNYSSCGKKTTEQKFRGKNETVVAEKPQSARSGRQIQWNPNGVCPSLFLTPMDSVISQYCLKCF
jgi:hypothetical protein